MLFWSSSKSRYAASSRWTEEVALPTLRLGSEKRGYLAWSPGIPTPATSTTMDDNLPFPAVQKPGNVVALARRKRKSVRIGLSVHWARFKRRIGTGTAPSSSSLINDSGDESVYIRRSDRGGRPPDDGDTVDEVVVDRAWSEDLKSSVYHSEHGGTPERTGSHQVGQTPSDRESMTHEGFWSLWNPLVILRWRIWPSILGIFCSRFLDEKSEQHYAQENWFLKKSLALWAALWLIINWVLGCIFLPNPFALMDKIFLFGLAPVTSLPIGLMIIYDLPRDRRITYQILLVISIWCWPYYQLLFMYLCGFYSPGQHWLFSCNHRDFLGTFYYATALQTIGLFGLKMDRLPAAVGASTFAIFASVTMIPQKKQWSRTMINFTVFHIFLIYVHYMRESSERRLFTLRDQLKVQYKATQKAQINERKAADSKRRLTSYVRVPLNTALLAVQNMEASGTVARDQEIEFNALIGSLSMMSKVLNDVLDFNRMDSGRFESASRPYAFHQVMRSLFIPLRLATNARGLDFVTDLDPNIDRIARKAAYEAMGEGADIISKHIEEHPDVDGVVTGDETRLRQIINNLASNACKFTPSGGRLSIKTRLILPSKPIELETAELVKESGLTAERDAGVEGSDPLSALHLKKHNQENNRPLDWVVVRIEVTDTGYGIRSRDMAESKLFSAFNQTEQGRQQGGKGTGLGLALVRQIVKLSGGRLGVRSKVGEGSMFWVELPLGVGRKTFVTTDTPELPEESTNRGGLGKVSRAAGTQDDEPQSISNSLTMAVDAAALKASRLPSTSTRSSSALHSLMEQGGRVELVLQSHDSMTSMNQVGGTTSPQFSPPSSPTEEDAPTIKRPPNSATSSASARTTRPRPTYVPIPSPQSFAADGQPSTSASNHSNNSISLTAFDSNNNRGNPSISGSAMNIEPRMPVLVVDDDPLTRMLMTRILTRLGCSVATAENGEMALEMILGACMQTLTPSSDASGNLGPILEQEQCPLIEEGKYAVVFLDNQMPVLSGLKAIEKLRDLGRKDFVVGVTGNALLTDQKEYLEAGVDRVLTKPVLERSLRDILLHADERRKKQSPTPA